MTNQELRDVVASLAVAQAKTDALFVLKQQGDVLAVDAAAMRAQ